MNRISLIGMIFGLILISVLSFIAGFLCSYMAAPSPIMPAAPALPAVALPAIPTGVTVGAGGVTTTTNPAAKDAAAKPAAATSAAVATPSPAVADAAATIETDNMTTAAQRVPTEADAGKFSIQMRVFGERLWAIQTYKTLKKLGYGAYIVNISTKDRSLYDVRIGMFDNYVQANQFAREMRKMGHQSASVTMIERNLQVMPMP